MRSAYKILVGTPERKEPLGRLLCRWEYIIRMDLREVVWEGVNCIHLAQDGGYFEYGNEPSGSIKVREFLDSLK
jgi:hypothetical protein